MRLVKLAREKLVEKDIKWKQVYTDKTLFLKEQFEDVVGQGSYFRFEGEDRSTGNEYYCIIGPAKIHDPIAKFFAGVRKLPATFSAGGKYFDSLDGAASYARDTWGVPTPNSLRPYTASHLQNIAKKVEAWKAKREQQEDTTEDKEASGNITIKKVAVQLPDSDVGAVKEQERTPVERQRAYPSTEVMEEQTQEIIDRIEADPYGRIKDEYGEEVTETIREYLGRTTGVASQVGEESWDDRSTTTHVDKRGPKTVLDLLEATDDILLQNPTIKGLKRNKEGKLYLNSRFVTGGAYQAFTDLLYQLYTEYGREGKAPEERGKYEGETSSLLGDSEDDFSSWEGGQTPEDILTDLGVDVKSNNKRKKEVLSHTIKNLIRIAEEEDNSGEYQHAEEIHKVIRKYKERIK